MIEVEDLLFTYESDGFTLRVPDLAVEDGAKVAFIGPSGSGKTTLFHLLAGILVPHSGRISVAGREVSGLPDAERRRFRIGTIGMIFQDFELLDHLTVRENILLPYYVNRALTLDGGVHERVEELARALGIGSYLRRRPAALSHGERQRAAICRALVTEPALVLADEPTGNLDPRNTDVILDLVFRLVEKRGTTFLMVTHDHSLLDRFDRTIDFMDFLPEAER